MIAKKFPQRYKCNVCDKTFVPDTRHTYNSQDKSISDLLANAGILGVYVCKYCGSVLLELKEEAGNKMTMNNKSSSKENKQLRDLLREAEHLLRTALWVDYRQEDAAAVLREKIDKLLGGDGDDD